MAALDADEALDRIAALVGAQSTELWSANAGS